MTLLAPAVSAPRLGDPVRFARYAASRLVVRAYRPVLDALGLTDPHQRVSFVLWEEDDAGRPASVGRRRERLFRDSGTLTPLLRRLEERGWVPWECNQDEERVVDVYLTAAGRGAHRAGACPHE